MAYWLMKSEPEELSILDLQRLGSARWDGVRNYQARNFLRQMQLGDSFFFYHSSCPQPGIAGIGTISASAYADPAALDPHSGYYDGKASSEKNPWSAVTVAHHTTFKRVLSLAQLRQQSALSAMPLLQKGSRLSVMPVTPEEWQAVLALTQ
jgi:predicted RNA-binding protein with PUA-like domain